MSAHQNMVEEFHIATGSTVGSSIELRDRELRAHLIMEEAMETIAAMGFDVEAEIAVPDWSDPAHPQMKVIFTAEKDGKEDLDEAIDGLCDLLYVTYGTAVAWGVWLDPFFKEVHRANMEKLDGPKRADGKQLKPKGWQPPKIAELRKHQQDEDALWAKLGEAVVVDGEVIG